MDDDADDFDRPPSLDPSWEDSDIRERLVADASAGRPRRRRQALRALGELARAHGQADFLWSDPAVRAALLAGAAPREPHAMVREAALDALAAFADAAADPDAIWEDGNARALLSLIHI